MRSIHSVVISLGSILAGRLLLLFFSDSRFGSCDRIESVCWTPVCVCDILSVFVASASTQLVVRCLVLGDWLFGVEVEDCRRGHTGVAGVSSPSSTISVVSARRVSAARDHSQPHSRINVNEVIIDIVTAALCCSLLGELHLIAALPT